MPLAPLAPTSMAHLHGWLNQNIYPCTPIDKVPNLLGTYSGSSHYQILDLAHSIYIVTCLLTSTHSISTCLHSFCSLLYPFDV